jgi:hypothetical protein
MSSKKRAHTSMSKGVEAGSVGNHTLDYIAFAIGKRTMQFVEGGPISKEKTDELYQSILWNRKKFSNTPYYLGSWNTTTSEIGTEFISGLRGTFSVHVPGLSTTTLFRCNSIKFEATITNAMPYEENGPLRRSAHMYRTIRIQKRDEVEESRVRRLKEEIHIAMCEMYRFIRASLLKKETKYGFCTNLITDNGKIKFCSNYPCFACGTFGSQNNETYEQYRNSDHLM